jgi:hypothetical protein
MCFFICILHLQIALRDKLIKYFLSESLNEDFSIYLLIILA